MSDIELIIKIPKEDYKAIKNMSVLGDMTIPYVFDAIRNGTPLPENATNGDMIKAIFPDGIPKDVVWTLQGDKGADWWRSPYKRGETE